ncbi:MAG: ComEC/Rec2 family competence protein [Patescibacteria group bacterium]
MALSRSKIFLCVCLSFCAGVGVGTLVSVPRTVLVMLAGASVVLVCVFWSQRLMRLLCLCVLFFISGIFRIQLTVHDPIQTDIDFYNGRTVRFLGMISSEPDVRQDSVKLSIEALTMGSGSRISGLVLMTVPMYPAYQYGNLLEITCEIETPGRIALDDGSSRVFDYGAYLSRYEIRSVCYRPVSVVLRGRGHGNWCMAGLLGIKNRFIRAMQEILPEPFSSLLGGILLGAKKAMPVSLMDGFNRTGITHIVALSGFNITIIAVALSALTQRISLPRRMSFFVSCAAIALFVVMTGAQASAVRAGVMGGLVLLGRGLGRLSRITNVLLLAATAMVLINPLVLMFDSGFQLSFLATLGLLYLSPIFEKWFKHPILPGWLSSTLAATLSAIFFTAPLIAYQFGRLSVVAPIVNMLVVPVISLTMGIGFGATVLAMIWLPLGQWVGWLVGLVLRYIVSVTELFSGFQYASITVTRMSWIWPVAWYASLVAGILYARYRQHATHEIKA